MADYSAAQRGGFTLGFQRFRRSFFNDQRSDDQLAIIARALYKGCERHWTGSGDRVCKISEVKKEEPYFRLLIDGLETAEDMDDFNKTADDLVTAFPMLENWMAWWRQPCNASMIFRSQRTMDQALWDSLPDTSNAQEAVNWVLYSSVGYRHEGLEGIIALINFAESMEAMHTDVSRTFLSSLQCSYISLN